ncbi:MAG: rRNA maturation RNase YbeY [Anaerolineales bacterium]|nr:rRNA maturation RNase YbeY [Anaerolineales bacterium]
MKYSVEIQSGSSWTQYHQQLKHVAETTLAHASAESGSLTIVLTDKGTIRELNRVYAGDDHATDVLSFVDGTILPENDRRYFGDVIIAVDVAREQAESAGHSLQSELNLLVVHGVLHLLGHDHSGPEEKRAMWSAQQEVLHDLDVTLGTERIEQ